MELKASVPDGPTRRNKRAWFENKSSIPRTSGSTTISAGSALAYASAVASLAELGYEEVLLVCGQPAPRPQHRGPGRHQRGQELRDGDSVWRLFYDTVKGGDYRAREANVYRLAQISVSIMTSVAQGVPFAREYGGQLVNRSFGGTQVSRTFYARGQTGHSLPARTRRSSARSASAR
jgi:succinate dehydrogenase / fumarate reductase flavoprotein subunit